MCLFVYLFIFIIHSFIVVYMYTYICIYNNDRFFCAGARLLYVRLGGSVFDRGALLLCAARLKQRTQSHMF